MEDNMKHCKYLKRLGIKEEDYPWNWNEDDKRQRSWKKFQKIYGFDERDTWCLGYTIICLLYPRIKMYKDITPMDMKQHKFIHKDKELTEEECINIILEQFECYLKDKDGKTNTEEAFTLLGKICPILW
jgi:hypothetical protein